MVVKVVLMMCNGFDFVIENVDVLIYLKEYEVRIMFLYLIIDVKVGVGLCWYFVNSVVDDCKFEQMIFFLIYVDFLYFFVCGVMVYVLGFLLILSCYGFLVVVYMQCVEVCLWLMVLFSKQEWVKSEGFLRDFVNKIIVGFCGEKIGIYFNKLVCDWIVCC